MASAKDLIASGQTGDLEELRAAIWRLREATFDLENAVGKKGTGRGRRASKSRPTEGEER